MVNRDPLGLMQLSKVDFDPRNAALMVIDMQKGGCDPNFGRGRALKEKAPEAYEQWYGLLERTVVPNIKRLQGFFRQEGLRVVFFRNGVLLPDASDMFPRRRFWEEQQMKTLGLAEHRYPGTARHEVLEEITPLRGELVLDKNSSSAFNSTCIDQILRNWRVDSLVITGMATNGCVETTARDAADRGYNCILLDDACACRDPEAHQWTLKNFSSLFGVVMRTDQVLAEMERHFQPAVAKAM
ncbi:MAG: cysteine hydrolase [Betaproteobacteria bacterium]|nr:cysteine hydrolase [Betaproteobacteria bacterium]